MMKSYFMMKQKSAPTSAEIDRIAVFPDLRVMLHSTPAASGKIWSLSTSIASRTPQKTKYQARSSYETIQFNSMIQSTSMAIILRRLEMGLYPLSLFSKQQVRLDDLFVIIINIMNITIISTIITNSITKVEFDFLQCNTKQ